jgi:hypothetical protein
MDGGTHKVNLSLSIHHKENFRKDYVTVVEGKILRINLDKSCKHNFRFKLLITMSCRVLRYYNQLTGKNLLMDLCLFEI